MGVLRLLDLKIEIIKIMIVLRPIITMHRIYNRAPFISGTIRSPFLQESQIEMVFMDIR